MITEPTIYEAVKEVITALSAPNISQRALVWKVQVRIGRDLTQLEQKLVFIARERFITEKS